jgi:uncharacterized phage-associated protein
VHFSGENVPAWSNEIANELIKLALADGKAFHQMYLQELVYIAHGWHLAFTGEPLTGDRPEAFEHGPEYRRLATALAGWGVQPVKSEIKLAHTRSNHSKMDATFVSGELLATEREILGRIYVEYGNLQTRQLASLTREDGTPWEHVFAGGAGIGRDIPHQLIKIQFEEIAAKIDQKASF